LGSGTIADACGAFAPSSGWNSRTTMACEPPLAKKSRTAKPRLLCTHSGPKTRSKSALLFSTVGSFTGPRRARPMNAVIEVATPVMVCTPLGTSSTYTPG
jgi:hypothetical protein